MPAVTAAGRTVWPAQALDPARWRIAVLLLGLGTAAVSLLSSLGLPYWRFADQDIILAYNALLLNEGLPQEYFDHPGYGYFLIIALWYKFLHGVGLLDVFRLGALPAAGAAGFEPAWQSVVQAGRVLTALLAAGFVMGFTVLARRILQDRGLAVLAGFVLAVGQGVMSQTQVMRTELVSGSCVVIAFLLVVIAARAEHSRTRLVGLAVAGLLAAFAMITKLQALLTLLAIPILAIAYGEPARADAWRQWPAAVRWGVAGALVALAAALGVPAVALIRHGIDTGAYHAVGAGLSGNYQWLLALYVAGAMIVYAWRWRVPVSAAIGAAAALAAGAALGLLCLHILPAEENIRAVANPIEHMYVYATWKRPDTFRGAAEVLSPSLFATMAENIGWALLARSGIVYRDYVVVESLVLEWFVVVGAIVLWWRGRRRVAIQAGLTVLAVWTIGALATLRSQRPIYVEPLLVLAAAMVLANLPGWLCPGRPRRLFAAGLLIWAALGLYKPVKNVLRHADPSESCYWIPNYLPRVEGFPFCPPAAAIESDALPHRRTAAPM